MMVQPASAPCPREPPVERGVRPREYSKVWQVAMRVLKVGGDVFLLRFLPDNRRLVVGTADEEQKVTFGVLSLPDGERVPLKVPRADLDSWWYHAWYGNVIAVPPSGE